MPNPTLGRVDPQVEVDRLQAPLSVRDVALRHMEQHLSRWGVVLPPAEPLVLDFGLEDFQHVGLVECWIANEVSSGYCGKYLFLADAQRCPEHYHEGKHETFFIVRGTAQMVVDGRPQSLDAGAVLPMPPRCVHGFSGAGPVLILEVSTPCLPADNHFTDPRVDAWLRRVTGNGQG